MILCRWACARPSCQHRRVGGADAFFVYVDCEATPQLLGGLVVITMTTPTPAVTVTG